jgi:hypothetical protein
MCPVGTDFPIPDDDSSLTINVYDRNTSADVECSLLATDTDGNVSGNFGLVSAGGGPGSSVQFLSRTYRQPGAFTLSLLCVIPPTQDGAVSHLTSYSVPSGSTISRHGSSCVPVDNTHRGRIAYGAAVGVYNGGHSGPGNVVCDLSDAVLFGGWVGPGLVVYDRSTQGDISCTFRMSNSDGTATDPEFSGQSTGNFNTAQPVGGTAFTHGTQLLTVECSIPQLMPTSNSLSSMVVLGR